MFDAFLQKRAAERGEAFRPFDIDMDYRLYWTASLDSTAFATF
jgi:hypothetical protein